MMLLYNIFIRAYVFAIRVAANANSKAKEWIEGRKNIFSDLQSKISASDKVIWMHCSSAGEFEQGLPVAEALQQHYPSHKILITFFSPSGMKAAKKYAHQFLITYLPADTKKNAEQFIKTVHPQLVIFVKYEFWFHHLQTAAFRHIPILLISAVFRNDQLFFKSYGKFYRQVLFLFRNIFVQDEASLKVLQDHSINHCSIGGDTRFDRVIKVADNFTEVPHIKQFLNDQLSIVAGSTWPDDENLLLHYFEKAENIKLIIAPHEVTEGHIQQIEKLFPQSVRYSSFSNANQKFTTSNVLIIDSTGILSKLYQYATIAYVGGGFTKDGIHNILEAAVYGTPVVFGPNYKKYREATELIEAGGAFSISNGMELKKSADDLLNNSVHLQSAGNNSKNYVALNTGATEKVIQFIQEKRLLTS